MLTELQKELRKLGSPEKAVILSRFFKTGKGEYGEGDRFLGVTVPDSRKIARKYSQMPQHELNILLKSKYHEERLVALLILVHNFQKGTPAKQKEIFAYYLNNTRYINNWDLVDLTAHKIVGAYLSDKPKDLLFRLAGSSSLWERRISIIATFQFLKNGIYVEALKLAKVLLNDREDLIQKAVGWMLREAGKKNFRVEEDFLKKNYRKMGRTMLRYAIEKFPENLRQKYLKNKI